LITSALQVDTDCAGGVKSSPGEKIPQVNDLECKNTLHFPGSIAEFTKSAHLWFDTLYTCGELLEASSCTLCSAKTMK